SEAAALEFAILEMKISTIIICGHSDCRAVNAAMDMQCSHEAQHLRWWLRHIEPAVQAQRRGEAPDTMLPEPTQVSQLNVLRQVENMKTHPVVSAAIERGELAVHAWFFDLKRAELQMFDEKMGKFRRVEGK